MVNDDDDDESEDDQVKIARMFERAEVEQKAKLLRRSVLSNDDEDEDEGEDDGPELMILPPRKRRNSSIGKYERVQQRMQRANQGDSSSSDDDEDDAAEGPSIVVPTESKPAINAACLTTTTLGKENIDSDDDDINRTMAQRRQYEARQRGIAPTAVQLMQRGIEVSHVEAMQLSILREARIALQRQSSGAHVVDTMAPAVVGEEIGVDVEPMPKMLCLTIVPTVHYDAIQSHVPSVEPSVILTVPENTQVEQVTNQVLQALKLKPKTNRIWLEYNGEMLKRLFPLHHYNLPTNVAAKLDAVIRSSDLTAPGMKKVVAAAAPNVGTLISVKLQRKMPGSSSIEQETIMIGCNEKLQALADRYAQSKGLLSSAGISLFFDGDRLDLSTTPSTHEMDTNDLIDVVVS
jgi:Ubiquitin-2 like Rad60 SUMO-like